MDQGSSKVHILIVNDDSTEVENIKSWLERDMRIPWDLTHCISVLEVIPRADKADLIILKPELEGLTSPEDVFKRIGGMVFEIPILVLTDEDKNQGFPTYVMEQGAADTIIRGQFARLVDAIEFSLIRQRIVTDARISTDHTLLMSNDERVFDQERHKQILRMFSGDYSVDQR